MVISYYNGKDELCSKIFANRDNKTVSVENYTDFIMDTAFGVVKNPTWEDFEEFLEDRCFPRNRQNVKLELKQLGLTGYDPLEICKKTDGRNYRDYYYMTFDEEKEPENEDYDRES